MPNISMSPSARYVTQSGVYDCPRLGPLTDRKISKYQKLGWYSGIRIDERKEQRQKRAAKRQRMTREAAFAMFDL